MYHNAAIVVLATLVTKAAGYATLPKTGARKDFGTVDTATESAGGLVVPDECDFFGTGCPCGTVVDGEDLGAQCTLLGRGAVEPRNVDVNYINYCYDYCFADGEEYKTTTGGKAPCYGKCAGAATMWQQGACSNTYQLDEQSGSVFYEDNSRCAAGAVSAEFCAIYNETTHTEWVGNSCQKSMKRLRNVGGRVFEGCEEPFTAECSKEACDSLLYMGRNSMNGGVAHFCEYDEDTEKCNAGPTMQVDDLENECEFSMDARRKLQDKLAELRK